MGRERGGSGSELVRVVIQVREAVEREEMSVSARMRTLQARTGSAIRGTCTLGGGCSYDANSTAIKSAGSASLSIQGRERKKERRHRAARGGVCIRSSRESKDFEAREKAMGPNWVFAGDGDYSSLKEEGVHRCTVDQTNAKLPAATDPRLRSPLQKLSKRDASALVLHAATGGGSTRSNILPVIYGDDISSRKDTTESDQFVRYSPRRTMAVQFTCNVCGTRTERRINPKAYADGTVFVQCSGCSVHHKLIDNLNLYYECNNEEDGNDDNNLFDKKIARTAEQMISVFPSSEDVAKMQMIQSAKLKQVFQLRKRENQIENEEEGNV